MAQGVCVQAVLLLAMSHLKLPDLVLAPNDVLADPYQPFNDLLKVVQPVV